MIEHQRCIRRRDRGSWILGHGSASRGPHPLRRAWGGDGCQRPCSGTEVRWFLLRVQRDAGENASRTKCIGEDSAAGVKITRRGRSFPPRLRIYYLSNVFLCGRRPPHFYLFVPPAACPSSTVFYPGGSTLPVERVGQQRLHIICIRLSTNETTSPGARVSLWH